MFIVHKAAGSSSAYLESCLGRTADRLLACSLSLSASRHSCLCVFIEVGGFGCFGWEVGEYLVSESDVSHNVFDSHNVEESKIYNFLVIWYIFIIPFKGKHIKYHTQIIINQFHSHTSNYTYRHHGSQSC